MAGRDHQYLLDDPHMEDDDEEESSDEEPDRDERVNIMELDSPDEFDDDDENIDDPFYDERPNNSMVGSTDDDLDGEEDEEDDDDAMTWDTLSEASVEEVPPPDHDEWYPLATRDVQIPNFALPTTTRPALNSQSAPQYLASSSRSYSDNGTEEGSEAGDLEFNHFVGVMRPEPTRSELIETVLDYFLHHGHSEVVHTFCKEMNIPLPEKEIQEMNVRNEVRDLIWAGEMEKAIERIPANILATDENVNFAVRKQHIIEMIRADQLTEPVEYFRKYLMIDGKRPDDDRMTIIEEIFTLMVFADTDSEFSFYMEQKERELTAKIVNSALLGLMGQSRSSQIDLLAKSIAWAQNEIAIKRGTQKDTTTVLWAEQSFAKEFAMDDLVSKAINHCPIDDTTDLC